MDVVPLILDSRPAFLGGDEEAGSLLTLPLGVGTVLSVLRERIQEAGGRRIRVLPVFRPSERYVERLSHEPDVEVVTPKRLTTILHTCEPSDDLLILDPRYWPLNGYDLVDFFEQRDDRRWALHAVAVGSDTEQAQEYIRCDAGGYVRCVRRYYQSVTWPKTGPICATLVPVSAAEDVAFSSLLELRNLLALRGMLSKDVRVAGGCVDLTEERGFLALQEDVVESLCTGDPAPGHRFASPGVLAGADVRVHPSARFVGPVILQKGAQVEEGAMIVGPALISESARVRRGALAAQAVLTPGVSLAADAAIRHRVWTPAASAARQSAVSAGTVCDMPRPTTLSHPVGDWSTFRTQAPQGRLGAYPAVKLLIEVTLATASLLVMLPLLLAIALLVKLDSRGPVFFLDKREGKGGRLFKCIKFRTMRRDAHLMQRELYAENAVDGPQFKLPQDPRITRVGRWLRSTNLDELPQLINVMLGEMSLVGPRPSPFRENQICIPWRRARLSVRPGITGLWQVCRHDRDEGDFHQWIAYDIAYVRHQSFMLDLRILAATILTFGGKWSVSSAWILGRGAQTGRLSVGLPAA